MFRAYLVLAAVILLATKGLHFSIEFTGGTVVELAYEIDFRIGKDIYSPLKFALS